MSEETPVTHAIPGEPLLESGYPVLDPSWVRAGYVQVDIKTRQIVRLWITEIRIINTTTDLAREDWTPPEGKVWLFASAADPSWPTYPRGGNDVSVAFPADIGMDEDNPRFFGYDGSLQTAPVNQDWWLREWQPHIARLMHGWSAYAGDSVLTGLTAEKMSTLTRVIEGLAGHAWYALNFWNRQRINPIDPTTAPTENWLAWKPAPERAVTAICESCNTETIARRMARRLDYDRFKAKTDAAEVWSIDSTGSVWVPKSFLTSMTRTNLAEAPDATSVANFFDNLAGTAGQALDWYDDHLAHREIPHGH